MSYILSVSRDKPRGLWPLDGGSLLDYSGFGVPAVLTAGTPAFHAPLTANVTSASQGGSGLGYNFPFPYARPSASDARFSVEAWFYPINTVKTSILSHNNQYDLLSYENGVVTFRLDFVDAVAPSASVSYKVDTNKNMHIVGVYSTNAITLYVNGDMQAQLELTDEQEESDIAVTTDNGRIYYGQGSGARSAIQGVAWYDRVLNGEQIYAHYAAGKKTVPSESVGAASRPNNVNTSMDGLNIFLRKELDEDDEWREGSVYQMLISQDMLMPDVDENLMSLPATWMGVFPLDFAETTNVAGVVLEWEADGATVSVSVDGTTWEICNNGSRISMVKDGYASTGKDLWLRVSFPGLKMNDQSYLESLTVTGYASPKPQTLISEPNAVTTTGDATRRMTAQPIEYRDDAGTLIQGGSMTITPDATPDAVPPRTVEFWAKRLTSADLAVNVSGTQYVNAVVQSADGAVGEWCLYHVVSSSNITGAVTFTGNAIINGVRFYNPSLTASEITGIFKSFTGVPVIPVLETGVFSVNEDSSAVKIYANDFSLAAVR